MKQILTLFVMLLVSGCFTVPVPVPVQRDLVLGNEASPQKALVIGNGDYDFRSLRNTANDAVDIADELAGMNFHVIRKLDLNRKEMQTAIHEFVALLEKTPVEGRTAVFFFAGHGTHVENENFLIPVNNNVIKRSQQLQYAAVNVKTEIVEKMETANENGVNLIVLDACRNNPFPTIEMGLDRGFAPVRVSKTGAKQPDKQQTKAVKGTLITYAADIGETTLDVSEVQDRNSVYTGHLLKVIKDAKKRTLVKLSSMFVEVQRLVNLETGQEPWLTAELSDEICMGSNITGIKQCK